MYLFGAILICLFVSGSSIDLKSQNQYDNIASQISYLSKTPKYRSLLRAAELSIQQETAIGLHRRGNLRDLHSPIAGPLYRVYEAQSIGRPGLNKLPFDFLYEEYIERPCHDVTELDEKLNNLAQDKQVITLKYRQDDQSAILRKLIEICRQQSKEGAKQQVYEDFKKM